MNLNNLRTSQRKSRLRLKATASGTANVPTNGPTKSYSMNIPSNVPSSKQQQPATASRNPTSTLNTVGAPVIPTNPPIKQATTTPTVSPSAASVNNQTANLFDYEDTSSPTQPNPKQATPKTVSIAAKPAPAVEQDLFTFDEPPVQAQPKNTSSKPSVALQNAAAAAGVNINDNPTANLSRAELKSLHKAEIDDKVKRALESKQEVDDMQRKEAEELDIVSYTYLCLYDCKITYE